jgi:hypothetical protein
MLNHVVRSSFAFGGLFRDLSSGDVMDGPGHGWQKLHVSDVVQMPLKYGGMGALEYRHANRLLVGYGL